MNIQATCPLTLTLSPSAGEREQLLELSTSFARHTTVTSHGYAMRLAAFLPLPFGRGEGRGEGPLLLRRYD